MFFCREAILAPAKVAALAWSGLTPNHAQEQFGRERIAPGQNGLIALIN